MILYIAGPYRGDVAQNIAEAQDVALAVWRAGHIALCPHLNTAHFDTLAPDIPDDVWLSGTLDLMMRCDGVVCTSRWEASYGARVEVTQAKANLMPVWVYPALPAE